jgi:purine-nucleoside phosphorylase
MKEIIKSPILTGNPVFQKIISNRYLDEWEKIIESYMLGYSEGIKEGMGIGGKALLEDITKIVNNYKPEWKK